MDLQDPLKAVTEDIKIEGMSSSAQVFLHFCHIFYARFLSKISSQDRLKSLVTKLKNIKKKVKTTESFCRN